MKTSLTTPIQQTSWGEEADSILRACVHCGFCTAVCPTYQLLGNELDSPRGRVYLIKSSLEGYQISRQTQQHLDRCLTCLACETTCPSGVQYRRLIEIGRSLVATQVNRPLQENLWRWGLRTVLPHPTRFHWLLNLGRLARPILPAALQQKIPSQTGKKKYFWPIPNHVRHMMVFEGCVQPSLAPQINIATAYVLDKLGISLLRNSKGCCGALNYHLGAHEEGLRQMRQVIDECWPFLETGCEAIVVTASGCASFIKEYGYLLKDDPIYAEKAAHVSQNTYDLSEVLSREDINRLLPSSPPSINPVALHQPCTLQHGQKIVGLIEPILSAIGFELTTVPDSHLCCGSAGAYSMLQPTIAHALLTRKLKALHSGNPQVIATANIGCQMFLQSQTKLPVKHWIELIAEVNVNDEC
jgi:glycolate oxidase iron-sulfur subunit